MRRLGHGRAALDRARAYPRTRSAPADRIGRRQPAGADPGALEPEHPDLRPPGHGPAGGADRAGARRRLLVQRQRGDPRRRQQVCGRGRDRARPAPDVGRSEPPAVGLELLFTVCEEVSLRGSREFDVSQLRSAFGYVFDHATPIGEIVIASPTHYRIVAEFRGRAAHAGVRPEAGASAIAAAPRRRSPRCGSVGSTPRRPPMSALIDGGTAINVVPERCRVEAEVRSLDDARRRRSRPRPSTTCRTRPTPPSATSTRRRADVPRLPDQALGAPRWSVAERALRACGYEPKPIDSGGASDANSFQAAGLRLHESRRRDRATTTSRASGSASRRSRTCSRSRSRWSTRPQSSWARRPDERALSTADRRARDQLWQGTIFSAGVERFRHADGAEVTREKVWHPGAVGILAVDDTHVWLTRQPREAAGLPDSLEIPAGKRDVDGEAPLETARRELAEEIGKRAEIWEEIKVFYTSPGFSDERVWWYLARDLSDASRRRARPRRADRDRRRGRWISSTRRSPSARTRSR